ncbi:AMP-binding protein [Amycolatopsis magusensis]|uniref:Acyl-coenzyme A synthetase/AMP-(Fatty) acid ligase n=1 Tax=Amycolatopsis magusensis TaxID=882444 RepID=A0ABS4PXT3_9PSEU|nr:AMP-binding protein [Amycolatopsis magusensis]MBP2184247.1 acyl-coenzyme A synthetase/AMP-(fatty) acid ligase [Amycolatopsis magusensis]
MWTELTPAELLSGPVTAPRIADEPWFVRWDRLDLDVDELVARAFPNPVDLHTSGTTGQSRAWRRTREQLWAEAGLLAGLLAPRSPQAVLSFVPPRHIFGMLVSVLVPARLRVPVWYRPALFGPAPGEGYRRWAVMAIPWVFSLLRRNMSWVSTSEHLTVLHSTATLPATAADFLAEAGPERASIVEVFGSTETGGIAKRQWAGGDPLWELFDDVRFLPGRAPAGKEVPLAISSPRLAAPPGEPPPESAVMDDLVLPVGEDRFRFVGRRSRLVKVNGRRMDLDELERSLRSVLRCADLAILPVTDAVIGEHIDLLVVPETGVGVDARVVREHLGVRPRRTLLLGRIDRTDTGKALRAQRVIG